MKLVTFIGGSGFLGKSYLDAFNRNVLNKFKIRKINLISRNILKIKKTGLNLKKIKLIPGDICKLKSIPKSDLIIYAAEPANLDKIKDTRKFIVKSKRAVDNFCNIIKSHKNVKILYISSGAVYKFKNSNFSNENSLKGKKLYAYLKLYSENKIKNLQFFGIKTSIARCFTFVGPWLPRKSNFAIGNFIENILKGKKIHVKAESKVYRSYMFSDDLAFWITKICNKANLKPSIFDVGSDQVIEMGVLAKLFSELFKVKIRRNKLKKNKIDKYVPNIHAAKKKLGLKIKYNLKDSILLTINRINEKKN